MARVVWKKNPAYRGRSDLDLTQPQEKQDAPSPEPPESITDEVDERFSADYLRSLRELDPSLETREQLIQRARELEALRVLGGDTEYDWLTRKDDPGDLEWKRRLLAELGRFEDSTEMQAVARELCLIQPTPEDAIALVSRFLRGEARPKTAAERRDRGDAPYVAAEYVNQERGDSQRRTAADDEDVELEVDDEDFPADLDESELPPPPDDSDVTDTTASRAPEPTDQAESLDDEATKPSADAPEPREPLQSSPYVPMPRDSSTAIGPQEAQLAREITDAMNRAIVDFGMRHDLSPQQVRRALMHSALEVLRNCID